jgi:hypothetical protein
MEYEKFVFYGSFRKTIEVLSEQVGNKILRAIMNYGTSYELPEIKSDDPDSTVIYAIMQQIIPNIEAQKTKYENASNGGRPVNHPQEDFDILFNSGFTNVEIVKQIGCSEKTVERRKKIWNNNSKETETEEEEPDIKETKQSDISNKNPETSNQTLDTRHKILDTVGYDGFVGDKPEHNQQNDNKSPDSTSFQEFKEEEQIKNAVLSDFDNKIWEYKSGKKSLMNLESKYRVWILEKYHAEGCGIYAPIHQIAYDNYKLIQFADERWYSEKTGEDHIEAEVIVYDGKKIRLKNLKGTERDFTVQDNKLKVGIKIQVNVHNFYLVGEGSPLNEYQI